MSVYGNVCASEDEMVSLTGSCRLARIDVADNDDVNMNLFFTANPETCQLLCSAVLARGSDGVDSPHYEVAMETKSSS